MSYSREEVKAITDKVLNMAKADAVEVRFSGGERSATRYANSTITANLVEHDQEVQITVCYGQKSATTSTHQFDDASLKRAIEQAQELAKRRPDNPELMPLVKPPQDYLAGRRRRCRRRWTSDRPSARGWSSRASTSARRRACSAPATSRSCTGPTRCANSEGLFAYYRYAEASFILTCRTPDGTGSGWAGHDRPEGRDADRRGGDHRDRGRQGAEVAQAAGARTGQLHRHPRAAPGGALPVADAASR